VTAAAAILAAVVAGAVAVAAAGLPAPVAAQPATTAATGSSAPAAPAVPAGDVATVATTGAAVALEAVPVEVPSPVGFPVDGESGSTGPTAPPAGQPPDPAEPAAPGDPGGPDPTPPALPGLGFAAGPSPAPTPPDGLVGNGGEPDGCAAGCITKAWLTPSHTTTDVSLEVRTDTAARIVVSVGRDAPLAGPDGSPQLTDPAVVVSNGAAYGTEWTTTLEPLEPDTAYHIVVRAEDAYGGVTTEAGDFRTAKPVSGYASDGPTGCAAHCVTKAVLNPMPGSADVELVVETLLPARLTVYVDESAPQTGESGQPAFPGVAPAAESGAEFRTGWTTTLELAHATAYHVILQATDSDGGSQFLTAQLTTQPEPVASHQNRVLVTFHKIHVSDDADDTFLNRTGELTFRFAVAGEWRPQLDTGQRKVRSPEWVGLGDGDRAPGRSVLLEHAPDVLDIRVQGQEEDGYYPGFCSAGTNFFPETSGKTKIDKCFDLEWNSAEGSIDLHPDAAADPALPPCYGFGDITGDICVLLSATGDDPRFDVYVTVDFLD
jgi:hypothetical protein